MANIPMVQAMLGALVALGMQGALAQGKPKPPADKAPSVQENRPATSEKALPMENFHAQCIGCHGPDGNKPSAPDQPVLAGQYQDYLARALTDYKNGRRNNAIMKGFAGQLSKQDIEDLAAWFSSQQQTALHDQR